MSITHSIKLVPFAVPIRVYVETIPGLRQHGMQSKEAMSISIGELSVAALEELCAQFTADVLNTAKTLRENDKRARILEDDPT